MLRMRIIARTRTPSAHAASASHYASTHGLSSADYYGMVEEKLCLTYFPDSANIHGGYEANNFNMAHVCRADAARGRQGSAATSMNIVIPLGGLGTRFQSEGCESSSTA